MYVRMESEGDGGRMVVYDRLSGHHHHTPRPFVKLDLLP